MYYFSEREDELLKVLGGRKMSIKDLTLKMSLEKSFDCEIAVGNCVRRIIRKCEHYKLNWTLTKTRESGKLLIKKEKI